MKRWLVVAASILLAALAVAHVAQSQPLAVVQGQLRDQQGEPVAYQPIVIQTTGAQPTWYFWWGKKSTFKALTDEKGVFQVIDLPPGRTYEVKTLKAGAEPITIGTFDTPDGYRKIDVSNKLDKVMWAP